MSTASMGKYDRKLKNEKEINPLKKKKETDQSILLNRKQERDRNNRIFTNLIAKKK